MAQPAFGAGRWAAVRALREGNTPTYPLLARVTGLHAVSIAKRSCKEKWLSPARLPEGDPDAPRGGAGAEISAADAPAVAATRAATGVATGRAIAEAAPEERSGRVLNMLLREVERIGAAAQAEGMVPDKAQMDAVWSMIRMLEKVEAFSQARAGGLQAKRDEEMGDVLARIDRRIEELARAYAQELVRGELERSGSAADRRGMDSPGAA